MSLDSLKQEASSHNTSPQKLRELAAINDELARLVAANPLADCSLLEELAMRARESKDVEMQRALVGNPNTPAKWLIGLASLFPEEFFNNPVYSLAILEDINFSSIFEKKLLLNLVYALNAPTSFLEFAASIAATNLERIRNDKFFEHLSLERQYEINISFYKQVRLRPSYLFEIFWKWREILILINYLRNMLNDFSKGRYKEYSPILIRITNLEYYSVILASSESTSPQILSKLAQHPIQAVRVLVASHHNISKNSLNKLIDDCSMEVRAAALANAKLDSILKEQLVSLENPNLSSIDLLELAYSEYSPVRARVARHQNVDASILTKIANDKLIVRLAVARNPKTPTDILIRFTKHPDRRLHLAVAQNAGAPIDLLIQLATQPAVRGGFYFNPLNLAAVKSLLTQEPDAAIPFLDRCLKFPNQPSFSRFLVLMNPHIPSSFLARYYKSWFWAERYAIAQNPNTDRNICQQLAQDPNCLVRAAAQKSLLG